MHEWLGLYRLAPTPKRLKRVLRPMFKDEPIDEEVLEMTEAVFRMAVLKLRCHIMLDAQN
jgi:hypothetical protein